MFGCGLSYRGQAHGDPIVWYPGQQDPHIGPESHLCVDEEEAADDYSDDDGDGGDDD